MVSFYLKFSLKKECILKTILKVYFRNWYSKYRFIKAFWIEFVFDDSFLHIPHPSALIVPLFHQQAHSSFLCQMCSTTRPPSSTLLHGTLLVS